MPVHARDGIVYTMTDTKKQVLEALQNHYKDRWNIRRAGTLWVASAVGDPDHAPTVCETDLERFVAQLEFPPPRYGGHPLLYAVGGKTVNE